MDEVLDEWEIYPSKEIASLTDNGSNMVAAFRSQVQTLDDDEDNVEEETEEEFGENESDEFESREEDDSFAFGTLGRLSCFSHTLQLIANKFA